MMVEKPAKISCANCRSAASSSAVAAGASARMSATCSAENTNVPAVAKKTVSTFVAARRSPPIAGPAKLPIAAIVLIATFAAVSSSGVSETVGSSADCAGLNVVDKMATSPASAYTMPAGRDDMTASPAPTSEIVRVTSANSITRSRLNRSLTTAAKGAMIAAGMTRIRATSATAPAPPSLYAKTPTATTYIHFPVSEPAQASSTRRRFGFAKTARNAPKDSASRPLTTRRIASFAESREDSGAARRLVGRISTTRTSRERRITMDNQERARARHEEPDNEDVEAHRLVARTDEEGDDVEAHLLQADRASSGRASSGRASSGRASSGRASSGRASSGRNEDDDL